MKRKRTPRPVAEITLELEHLRLTPERLKKLKQGFKTLLVATFGTTGQAIEMQPVSKLVVKHGGTRGTGKTAKKSRTP